ncbi:ubiquitin carboxyl-terminal hydrolase 40 [Rhinatrema bivittatum]|uniref:ubiquitin carboxyl-terminal hydrolase 40 n=1 Tax=Rhinatrema bivittatum TaxID=194408 RepID=UPI00112E05AB|nr:ubiquitin carboxyl-terminal hydrolase 40 [Rhinatrema bivittatum]
MRRFQQFLAKYCCCCFNGSSPCRKRDKKSGGQRRLLNSGGDPASAQSTIKSRDFVPYESKGQHPGKVSLTAKDQARNKDVATDREAEQQNTTHPDGPRGYSQARSGRERRQNNLSCRSQTHDAERAGHDGPGEHSQSHSNKETRRDSSRSNCQKNGMRQMRADSPRKSSQTHDTRQRGSNASKKHSPSQSTKGMGKDASGFQTGSKDSTKCSQSQESRDRPQSRKTPKILTAGMDNSSRPPLPKPDYEVHPVNAHPERTEAEVDKSWMPLIPPPDYPNEAGYVGLKNYSLNCCLNSLTQTLFRIEDLQDLLQQHSDSGGSEDSEKNVPHQLYQLFCKMRDTDQAYVSGYPLIMCLQKNGIQADGQLDAEELLRYIIEALKTQLACRSELAISKLFTVSAVDFLLYKPCDHSEVEEKHLLTIPLPLLQHNDLPYSSLEEALKVFFSTQVLDGDSMVYCQKCERTRKAHQGCRVRTYSPIVCLHLKRFTLDFNTGRPKKLYHYMKFPQEINFWSFHEQRAEKEELHSLFSVVAHSGNASAGHYLVYVRNQIQDRWHCINDTSVHPVSWEDVQKTFGGTRVSSPETAYLLFYKRSSAEISIL